MEETGRRRQAGTSRQQNDIMGLPVITCSRSLLSALASVLSSLKLKLSERAESSQSMSAVSRVRARAESVSAKRRKLDGSVTDRCQSDERVVARTIYTIIQPLPDFKLIFKIQPFCVCSSDMARNMLCVSFYCSCNRDVYDNQNLKKNLFWNARSLESKVLSVFNERLKESKLRLWASEAGILYSCVFVRSLSVSARRVWDIFFSIYFFLLAIATHKAFVASVISELKFKGI